MTISNNKKIIIIDSNFCNVGSVYRSIQKSGYQAIITKDAKYFSSASHIILPGVGSFDSGMKNLQENDLGEQIKYAASKKSIPLLGICLGMHLLGTIGFENGETKGLDLISGSAKKFNLSKKFKIPHMGWNEVVFDSENKIFENIENKKDFYFVHSYYFEAQDKNHIIGKTIYEKEFASVINKENIFGVQFHPEKSLKFGIKILENFLKL
jgi:glutamine amidotransferase